MRLCYLPFTTYVNDLGSLYSWLLGNSGILVYPCD